MVLCVKYQSYGKDKRIMIIVKLTILCAVCFIILQKSLQIYDRAFSISDLSYRVRKKFHPVFTFLQCVLGLLFILLIAGIMISVIYLLFIRSV